jgi:hypothetical protein
MLLFVANVFAQDCYSDNHSKGVTAYNNGKYAEAKRYFQSAQNCDMKPKQNDLISWIGKCDAKINEQKQAQTPKTQPSPSTAPRQNTTPKYYLETSVGSVNDNGSGSIITITIKTNAPHWNYEYVPSWCSIRNKTATSFELQIFSNPNTTSRSDWFNVKTSDGTVVKRITVTQAGKRVLYNLSVSPSVVNDNEGNGKTQTIYVTTNDPNWKVDYLPDWCYVTGRTSSAFVLNVKQNPSSTARNDWFNVKTSDGTVVKKITVTQVGKKVQSVASTPQKLTVSTNSINAQYSGGYIIINVTSTNKWDIYNFPSWCYITNKNNTSFKLNVTKNRRMKPRSDYFQVKTSDGFSAQNIMIRQAAKPSTLSTSLSYFSSWNNDYAGAAIKLGIKAYYMEVKTNFSFKMFGSEYIDERDKQYFKNENVIIDRFSFIQGGSFRWPKRFQINIGGGFGWIVYSGYGYKYNSGYGYKYSSYGILEEYPGLDVECGFNWFFFNQCGLTAGYSFLLTDFDFFEGYSDISCGLIFRW